MQYVRFFCLLSLLVSFVGYCTIKATRLPIPPFAIHDKEAVTKRFIDSIVIDESLRKLENELSKRNQ